MKKNTNPKDVIIKDKLSFKTFLKTTIWAMKWIISVSYVESILQIFLIILQSLIPILVSYINSLVFTQVALIIVNKGDANASLITLLPYLGMLLGTDFLSTIIQAFNSFITYRLKKKRRTKLEKDFILKMTQIDIQSFENKDISNIVKRAEDNVWKVEGLYVDIIAYIGDIIRGVSSLFIMISFLPILIPIALVLSAPIVIKDILENKKIRILDESTTEKWREYWTGRWFMTDKGALKELKIQNTTRKLHTSTFGLRENIDNIFINLDKKMLKFDILTRVNVIYSVVGLALIIQKILRIGGTIGQITFYLDRSRDLERFFSVLIRQFVFLYDQTKYIEVVKRFFEIPLAVTPGNKKLDINSAPKIEFRNVSFKYPKTKTYALRNINLIINPKEEIALVGENGAGKSTLVKLLLRLYDPTEGEIFVNDISLTRIDKKSYYSLVGALFQDYYYLGFYTLKQNIEFAKTKFSNMTYKRAAQLADIDSYISKLPKKYEHKSQAYFDNGVELSYGQSQKLAIARAFYRNAPILILDEPTASIDAIAEAKIFNRIYKFMNNKTVIIISHRFSTVRNAQKIYVLDKGKITESGSHEELMEKKGLYHKSFTLQAKGYHKETTVLEVK